MKQLKRNIHGEIQCYNYGCRCSLCKAANTSRVNEQRYRREREAKDSNDSRHGTRAFYLNHGCRCAPCCEAQAKVNRIYYEEHAPMPVGIPFRTVNSQSTSGKVGVSLHKSSGLWNADITLSGQRTRTYHKTFEEAVAAREAMEQLALKKNKG